MADLRKHSNTSNLVRCVLKHSTTGQGLTGLTSASAGLIIGTICDNEATTTAYTVTGSTIETIATLGTFADPTATKCRFREVDATNHPGLYEFQFADARFAVANAKRMVISVSGAANLLAADYEIQLTQVDVYSATAFMTSIASVVGAVGSVTGNVGGNVVGTVASVVGAVGSVTGNVGGSVASVVGNVGGSVASVVGAVGSVTGNVGGSVASVVATVSLTLSQALAQANLSASVTSTVGEALAAARAQGAGAWTLVGTTLTCKNPDGTTFRSFVLDSAVAPTSRT